MKRKKIAVVGLGYVGLPLALLVSAKGYDVVGIDIDEEKLKKIDQKISPFLDKKISDDLQTTSLKTTTQFDAISDRDIVIVCVPTPIYEDKKPDYSFVLSACENISPFLGRGQLVVFESTVNPGTTEEMSIPALEKHSNLKAGKDFYVAHVPERINPGDKYWNVSNIARVVGGYNAKSLAMTVEFYESILQAQVYPMESLKEAEAVKIVENCFRDINIAFVNELAMSFSHLGINLPNVMKGASTKPFEFLAHYPGCGVGGHCIPVDPYYLIDYATRNGFTHHLLSAAREINNGMPQFTVNELLQLLAKKGIDRKKARVCLLGLTYKPNIQDTRESPAFDILKLLRDEGIETVIHDPFVTGGKLDSVLSGVDAILLATAHREYLKLTPTYLMKKGIKIVVDGRNAFDFKLFSQSDLLYSGIGC